MKKVIAHEGLDKSIVGVFERQFGHGKWSYVKVIIRGDKWYIPYVFTKGSMQPAHVAMRTATSALAYAERTRDLNIQRAISARMSYHPPAPEPTIEDGVRVVTAKAK